MSLLCHPKGKSLSLQSSFIAIHSLEPISVDMGCNEAQSTVACSFEFTNNANEDVYLLKRNTPIEGPYSPFITLSNDDGPVPYKGPLVYRIPPTKDEFVLLKAGESITASIEITDIFDIDTNGLYTVRYSKPLQYLSASEESLNEVKESEVHESVDVHLENTHLLIKPTRPDETDKIELTVHLESCSSASFANGYRDYMATLDAHRRLCSGIGRAQYQIGYYNNLYRTWFGFYTTSRGSTVRNIYQYMRNGLAGKTVTYYNNGPACKSNWIAYTYKGATTVYLCSIYYNHPTACRGTAYTKEGTLLHEWAHAFGYRDDVTYGPSNCMNLARNSPDRAIMNADNYGYHYCASQ